MSGYTPLFSSLTTGTLCGKWPDIGLWPILLSLCDKHGVIDVTPAYIAGVTGLELEQVVACMRRFCEPDPYSRSGEHGGARLVLVDARRDWGWRVVNHERYRERARLQAKNAREVAEGANRARMNDRRPPPETAADHLSNANANANTDSERELFPPGSGGAPARQRATRLPGDFELTAERRAIATAEGINPERTFDKFRDYFLAAGGQRARKLDWDAAWRNWCRTEADRAGGAGSKHVTRFDRAQRALK